MNKFSAIIDELPADPLHDLTRKVLDNISQYLTIPVNSLLKDTDAFIFGGAIRDSIADSSINDVDILALPNSVKKITERLLKADYKFYDVVSVNKALLYINIRVINKPVTFINSKGKIVQIIRPSSFNKKSPIESVQHLLKQVDLSCCGVAYSLDNNTIIETYDDAINHCKQKVFIVLKDSIMHQKDRISERIHKLIDRGWQELTIEKFEKQNKMIQYIMNDSLTTLIIQSRGIDIVCQASGPDKTYNKWVGWIVLYNNGEYDHALLSSDPIFDTKEEALSTMISIVSQIRTNAKELT